MFLLLHPVRINAKLTRSGVAMKLVQQNGAAPVNGVAVDTLLKTIARGHAFWQRLQSENTSVTKLAKVEGMSVSYLTRVLRLAFLDPWITSPINCAFSGCGKTARADTVPIVKRYRDSMRAAGLFRLCSIGGRYVHDHAILRQVHDPDGLPIGRFRLRSI